MNAIRLRRYHNITSFAEKDGLRPVLGGVFYDSKSNVLVATDGRCMVVAPAAETGSPRSDLSISNDRQESFVAPASVLEAAYSAVGDEPFLMLMQKNGNTVRIVCHHEEDDNVVMVFEERAISVEYPSWRQIPINWESVKGEGKIEIRFGAEFVGRIMDYARKHAITADKPVTWRIADALTQCQFDIEVKPGVLVRGYLMPMRRD